MAIHHGDRETIRQIARELYNQRGYKLPYQLKSEEVATKFFDESVKEAKEKLRKDKDGIYIMEYKNCNIDYSPTEEAWGFEKSFTDIVREISTRNLDKTLYKCYLPQVGSQGVAHLLLNDNRVQFKESKEKAY